MLYYEHGAAEAVVSEDQARTALGACFEALGERRKVLIIPPDFTRRHSCAGMLTRLAWEHYGDAVTDILPALGTHSPMSPAQIESMFETVPPSLFRVHDWRKDVRTLGRVPAEFVREVSEGAVDFDWPAQVNRLLCEGDYDLILSVGQVVPHEVVGMAGYNKNIFVGTGGADGINRSHFIGAAYGMERMMGRARTPVRRVLNYAARHFAAALPIVYLLTVVRRDEEGRLALAGLFAGDDDACFERAAGLSLAVNFQMLDRPLEKVVCYLDPSEYKSTWLGNKSIYRTRMAIADGGELVVLAPGIREFGEDSAIDRVIRAYGYRGTPALLEAVAAEKELQQNLGAAAHLIHGSPEGRFKVTYCPGALTREEIEGVGFDYADLAEMQRRYDPRSLADGYNRVDGEEIFFVSNPALGLWAHRDRFSNA